MKYNELNVGFKKPAIWRLPSATKIDHNKEKTYNNILADIVEFDEVKAKVKEEVNHAIKYASEISNTKGQFSNNLSDLFEQFGKSVLMSDDYEEDYLLKKTNKNTLNKKLQPWCQNLVYNVQRVIDSFPLMNLFGKFKGIPAFVILAGPSLKNNIKELKKVGDKGIIIATDTAFRPCLDEGIKVHLVMAHDANPQGMRFFLLNSAKSFKTPMFVSMICLWITLWM